MRTAVVSISYVYLFNILALYSQQYRASAVSTGPYRLQQSAVLSSAQHELYGALYGPSFTHAVGKMQHWLCLPTGCLSLGNH